MAARPESHYTRSGKKNGERRSRLLRRRAAGR